jgi:hypothetical protein
MPIAVEWQDEKGRVLARYDGPLLHARLFEHAEQDQACLRFIDPSGDTTFNQLQLPVLLAELESLGADRELGEQLQAIRALLAFLERARDQPHTYVKLMSD